MTGIVWYYIYEDGLYQFEKVVQQYKKQGVEIVSHRKSSAHQAQQIKFSNGDCWKLLRAAESGRGHRSNVSYIDHRVDSETYNNIIRPQTILPPYQGFKIYYPPVNSDKKE